MAFTAQEWESIEEGQAVCVISGPGYAPTRDHATKVGKVVKKETTRWGRHCVIEWDEDCTQDTMHSVRGQTERAIGYYLLEEEVCHA